MKQIFVNSCRDCPYKNIWIDDLFDTNSRKDYTCSNYLFTVIPDIDTIPDWCKLEDKV